ncbi:MAG: hypothetical protein LBU37_07220 [Tannerellaceae bacterium]|jgi:hypothetical protein|nr:hypothetical protein [Tannerellaceae bacterium]
MVRKKKYKPNTRTELPSKGFVKAFREKALVAARKYLRIHGLDPSFIDTLSKKQQDYMTRFLVDVPRFRVEKGYRVPRPLLNFASSELHHFLRKNYYKDPDIGLTYLELMVYGISFTLLIFNWAEGDPSFRFTPEQEERLRVINECLNQPSVMDDFMSMDTFLQQIMVMISKMNFRIYGFNWEFPGEFQNGMLHPTIYLNSEEAVPVRVSFRNKERPAFRVRAGSTNSAREREAQMPACFLDRDIPDADSIDFDNIPMLDIYIQSHALQRIKERMDIFSAPMRNFYTMNVFLYQPIPIRDVNGSFMFICLWPGGGANVVFGYFPFVVEGTKVIVRTFIPPTFAETLDGQYLYKTLGLQKEDIKYLGMDKLSFFATVDFNEIPILKHALENTTLCNLINYFDRYKDDYPIDPKKTAMAKQFFEKKAAFDSEQNIR